MEQTVNILELIDEYRIIKEEVELLQFPKQVGGQMPVFHFPETSLVLKCDVWIVD